MVILTVLGAAYASELELSVARPGEPGLSCVASNVQRGELFSGPAIQMGSSSVTPLVEVLGLDASGRVYWRTSLMVIQSGLVSIARPDDRKDPEPCALGQGCALTFNRDEQTTQLVFTLSGGSLGPMPQEQPTWNTRSWFRDARALSCGPPAPAPQSAAPAPPLPE